MSARRPTPRTRGQRVARAALAAGLSLLATCALLELGTMVAVRNGWLATPRPNHGDTGFWWGGHPTLGVWRHPDREGQLTGACYSVTYHMNSVGARDRERPRRADVPRVVVLGDSFLEGWGVEEPDRLSNRLESATGIPHLNFAMAHFGPYQELLAYEEIASGFDHEGVVASVLPINDFADIDLEVGSRIPGYEYRYRPYLVGDPPDLREVVWREPLLVRFLRHHSYAWNAIARRIDQWRQRDEPPTPPGFSWFYDFEDHQARLLEAILERLADAVGDRPLAVLLIPALPDLQRYSVVGAAPLSKRLARLGEARGFTVVDLLPAMAEKTRNWPAYFLPCDYHWSRFGNRTAAELVQAALARDFYPRVEATASRASAE